MVEVGSSNLPSPTNNDHSPCYLIINLLHKYFSGSSVLSSATIYQAFKTCVPVIMGYVPMGMAFGILFSELGYHFIYATLMGLIVFAGTAQFLAVGLLASHAGISEVFVATLLLNLRHVFYGISLLNSFPSKGIKRWYMIFGTTDETYSLLSILPDDKSDHAVRLKFWIVLFNHCAWVFGCTLGGWLGSQITFSTLGIEFVLPALFAVLIIEQYQQVKNIYLILAAAGIGLSVLFLFGQTYMLITACVLAVLLLLVSKNSLMKS